MFRGFDVIENIKDKIDDQYRVNGPFDELLYGMEVDPRKRRSDIHTREFVRLSDGGGPI